MKRRVRVSKDVRQKGPNYVSNLRLWRFVFYQIGLRDSMPVWRRMRKPSFNATFSSELVARASARKLARENTRLNLEYDKGEEELDGTPAEVDADELLVMLAKQEPAVSAEPGKLKRRRALKRLLTIEKRSAAGPPYPYDWHVVTWEVRMEDWRPVWRKAEYQPYGNVKYPTHGEAWDTVQHLIHYHYHDATLATRPPQDGELAQVDADELLVLVAEQTA